MRKIFLGCFRLEGGEGGAEDGCVGTEMPRTPKAAEAYCSSACSGLSWLCPAPTFQFSLHPVPTGEDVKGLSWPRPLESQSDKGCPGFGRFSSLLLGNSPTHPHEHQKDINWFIEWFVCSRLLLWACQVLTGAPGCFLTRTPGAAFLLLPKGAAKPKLDQGRGNPPHAVKKWLGLKHSPQPWWLTAQVNSDTDPN